MCDHEEYVTRTEWRWNTCDEIEYFDVTEKVSADIDIDTHRYQCKLCGRVGYYSSTAKDFYEEGKVPNDRLLFFRN